MVYGLWFMIYGDEDDHKLLSVVLIYTDQ